MKTILAVLCIVGLVPGVALAESRSIALQITKGTNQVVSVSIYSEVQTEKKQNVSVSEAAKILKDAKGWGSMVSVVILTDGADLKEYMPIVQAIVENAWLGLDTIKPKRGMADHILKHYGIEPPPAN